MEESFRDGHVVSQKAPAIGSENPWVLMGQCTNQTHENPCFFLLFLCFFTLKPIKNQFFGIGEDYISKHPMNIVAKDISGVKLPMAPTWTTRSGWLRENVAKNERDVRDLTAVTIVTVGSGIFEFSTSQP